MKFPSFSPLIRQYTNPLPQLPPPRFRKRSEKGSPKARKCQLGAALAIRFCQSGSQLAFQSDFAKKGGRNGPPRWRVSISESLPDHLLAAVGMAFAADVDLLGMALVALIAILDGAMDGIVGIVVAQIRRALSQLLPRDMAVGA